LRSLAAEGLTALTVGADPAHDLDAATAAIDWADGPWLLPLAAGDRLAPGAAAAYRAAMTDPAARLIYADDDLLDRWDRRGAPHFKPEWNSELFDHHDYLTGACIVQAGRDDLAAVARQTDWAAALVARALTADGALARIRPTPIRRVLHHRCTRPQPRLPLAALPLAADLPLVSVIIPTRNRVDLLRTCLAGVAAAHYPAIEVIVVDNDSDDPATLDFLAGLEGSGGRVLRHAGPFNYPAINNRAVAEAKGDLICLLNNDIEMLAPDWLAIMATQALRDEVGAVGAQLLYPDGRIQHAGVVIGVGNAAGHAHRFLRPGETGYFHRHALPQFVSAVTAACLVVKRDRFLAVGGLDATGFPVAFNDVDLCLKLNQCGWQSFYEPRAVLVHHESVSRGFDHDPAGAARFAGELAALQQIWQTDEIVDPFHHPQLSRASEQFVVAL
jgi:GT2 family glycosyltransferase